LKSRGIENCAIERFKLGYRTACWQRWRSNPRSASASWNSDCSARDEALNGCLIIPILMKPDVTEMYGRKIGRFSTGTPLHPTCLPHREVFNVEALAASKSIISGEALIDALSFWCAGFENVTASYGIEGFTRDHREAFELRHRAGVSCYDRDDAGEERRGAVVASGEVHSVLARSFKGMDANDYACCGPACPKEPWPCKLDKAV
jgi:hypothetical protein